MMALSEVRAELVAQLALVPLLNVHPERPTIQTAYDTWVMWAGRRPASYCKAADDWDVYVVIPGTNLESLNEHTDAIVNDLIEALLEVSDITIVGPETLPANSDNTYPVIRARVTTTG